MSQVDRYARNLQIHELVERGVFHGSSPILSVDSIINGYVSLLTGPVKSLHAYISFVSTATFIVNAYIAPTISVPGTLVPIGNFNVASANTATCELRQAPTITNNGTKIADFLIPGGSTGNSIGYAVTAATKVILPPNTLFLFEIDNQGVGVQQFELQFNFHEI